MSPLDAFSPPIHTVHMPARSSSPHPHPSAFSSPSLGIVFIDTHVCMCTHTYSDLCTRTHTHTHTCARSLASLSVLTCKVLFVCLFVCFCLFAFPGAAPPAYGGSQARGQIRAAASSLRQSHSNTGSKPHLQPIPQLMATLDP